MKFIIKLIKKIKIALMSKQKYAEHLRKSGMKIGKGCDISKSIVVTEPWLVCIKDNVRITRNVQFITHDGSLWTLKKMGLIDDLAVSYGKILIKENCNIGWNVTIMPNVIIGKNCIIGAGAIVTKDIPDNSVAAGVPAKVIENIEEYALKKAKNTVPTMYMTDSEKFNYIKENRTDLLDFENF